MIARTFRAVIRPCLRTAAVVPVCAALVVGGCGSLNLFGEDAEETYIEGSVEQYAHYLKALSFFQDVRDTKRDPGPTRAAYEEFTLVAERFPSSKYADDSRRKANVLRDHLVGHEMEVGLFYQGKNQHLAAINRFKTVMQEYQGSRYVPEALHRMTESYVALGLRNEAQRTTAVLGRHFAKSQWYGHSQALLKGERTSPVRAATPAAAPSGGTEKKEAVKAPPKTAEKSSKKSWFGRLFDRIF